jgi:hypothetical protein
MEFAIVLILVFIVWTNEKLLGSPLFKEVPKKTAEDKFAEAIKDYLKDGIQVKIKGGCDKK